MHEYRHSLHRFSNYDVNLAFTNEDGIDVFLTGARFQQALLGGESELPVEEKEMLESSLLDRRRHPQSLDDDFTIFDLF